MPDAPQTTPLVDLRGKRGLIVGIANEHSIAAGCAEAFARCGARLAATYLNVKAEPFVRTVTDRLACELVLPLDVSVGRSIGSRSSNASAASGAGSIFCSIRSPLPRARIFMAA